VLCVVGIVQEKGKIVAVMLCTLLEKEEKQPFLALCVAAVIHKDQCSNHPTTPHSPWKARHRRTRLAGEYLSRPCIQIPSFASNLSDLLLEVRIPPVVGRRKDTRFLVITWTLRP
jgi:hypothetical protein